MLNYSLNIYRRWLYKEIEILFVLHILASAWRASDLLLYVSPQPLFKQGSWEIVVKRIIYNSYFSTSFTEHRFVHVTVVGITVSTSLICL